jgi:hypothetical protein
MPVLVLGELLSHHLVSRDWKRALILLLRQKLSCHLFSQNPVAFHAASSVCELLTSFPSHSLQNETRSSAGIIQISVITALTNRC